MKISRDMRRRFALVNALHRQEKPTFKVLRRETKLPESTLKRHLAALRVEFGMHIPFVRESGGVRGASGYYRLADWGILDREAFLRHHGAL